MRFYRIVITDPATGAIFREYSSLRADGTTNTGALNIEIDAPVTTFSDPMGDTGAAIRIWGISLQDIAAQSDFNGKTLQLYGGMAKGLPLANPAQAGLLLQGQIFQAYGNWVGVNMSLDLIVIADTGTSANPANIVLNWRAGQPLAQAIALTLATAFPKIGQAAPFNITSALVLAHDVVNVSQTLVQFARFIKQISADIINGPAGGTYTGVEVLLGNGQFQVYDGTSPTSPSSISFLDLVGQPTWLNPFQIQFITVMRHDITVGGYWSLPQGLVRTQPQGLTYFKDKPTFQGVFQIDRVRHAGNFRQTDAAAWVSVFDAHKVDVPAVGTTNALDDGQ